MWTDEDLDNLIRTKYPWFYETYTGYDKNIKRIDAARYFILFEYGGIYADMDFECVNNFEHLIPDGKVSIAESPAKNDGRGETHQNALMISPQGHPFWIIVFDQLERNKNINDVLYATGPQIIVSSLNIVDSNMINSLPSKNFAPLYTESFQPNWQTGNKWIKQNSDYGVYARHHGTAMWSNFRKI
jgi:mannosyltransferase OCH1-like enzyme